MGKKKASIRLSKTKAVATVSQEKAAGAYPYHSSLSPEFNWDGGTPCEIAEWLLGRIDVSARLRAPHQFGKVPELKGTTAIR